MLLRVTYPEHGWSTETPSHTALKRDVHLTEVGTGPGTAVSVSTTSPQPSRAEWSSGCVCSDHVPAPSRNRSRDPEPLWQFEAIAHLNILLGGRSSECYAALADADQFG